ncbi:HNH endonuclease [Acidocella sp.]|uniref:HNH endonuclease n=1 Tax=Acidocella sp. TaxID=50710 RepID=UPI002615070D|nr:HNH endonuclease [Acidocella sp.]
MGQRVVCKFKLVAIEADKTPGEIGKNDLPVRRLIPSSVKQEVWKRDGGKCVLCQSSDNLHFDHIVPFSKGGTSIAAKNIQLLCARHNLNKGNQII